MMRPGIVAGVVALGLLLALSFSASAIIRASAIEPPRPEPLATVYDAPGEGMRVVPQSDGPFYDMPGDIEQSIVCDRENRMYVLLRTSGGGVAIIPYLDECGSQKVMPRP